MPSYENALFNNKSAANLVKFLKEITKKKLTL